MNCVLDLSVVAIIILVFIDQAAKFYISSAMEIGESIPVINGIFHITYIENPGAAFGMFANQRWAFVAAALIVIIIACVFYKKLMCETVMVRWGAAMLLGGAVGNLIDRVRLGRVVDFLDFRIWPVFNIADIGICIGVAFLIYALFFDAEKEKG